MTFKQFYTQLIEKWLCLHDWKILQVTRHWDEFSNVSTDPPYKHTATIYCRKCGKLRRRRL